MTKLLARAGRALRSWGPELGRGLIEVAVGPDRPPREWSRRRSALVALSTVLGAILLLVAFVALYNTIHRYRVVVGGTPIGVGTPSGKTFAGVVGLVLLCLGYPLFAWRIGYAAVLLIPLIAGEARVNLALTLVLLLCYWFAGLRHGRPAAWAMFVLMLVPAWIWVAPGLERRLLATVTLLVVAVALDATIVSRRTGHALAAQIAQSELDEARRGVLEERTRIAREMHDVVAHHMSLIAVQAETAPYRLSELSSATVEEFAALSATAREALSDLRRLLGVLRSDSPAEREPQPQLADVAALVEASRRAGVEVELSMPANGRAAISHSVGLCAYRIVQEALSNAGRHAPGARVRVTVERDAHALRLEVVNGPPSAGGGPPAGGARPGHGIAGMRERVALLGGSLSAGPHGAGGFAVSAVLPLAETAEP